MDTADRALLKQLRPGADVRIIVENLLRIRNRALLDNLPLPVLGINCVLSEPALERLEELVAFAHQLDLTVHHMAGLEGLEGLNERPQALPEECRLRPTREVVPAAEFRYVVQNAGYDSTRKRRSRPAGKRPPRPAGPATNSLRRSDEFTVYI